MKKLVIFISIILLTQISFVSAQNNKSVIMIDLDGVLDDYKKYDNNIPKIKKEEKEFIKNLHETNKYNLVLFTTISPKLATYWLIDNNIDKYFTDVTNIKYPATIYLDDRAIQFNGDYKKTLKDIENFKVYWK